MLFGQTAAQPQRFSVLVLAIACVICLGTFESAYGEFTIGANFTGSNSGQSGFYPPNTMGAVGPDHVVELIHGRFAAYNRTGTLQASSTLDDFWTSAGLSVDTFSFDPRIVYDSFSGRWFATAVDNVDAANGFLVGVSNSSDPTAGWSGVKVDSDADDSHGAVFSMLGVNQDIVTVGANMFSLSGFGSNTGFIVIDKSSLISGTPMVTRFEDVSVANTGFTAHPVFDLDNKAGSMRILSSFNKPGGALKVSSIGGTSTSPSLITAGGFITVTGRGSPPSIDQPGTKANIDTGNTRFGSSVVEQQIAGRTNSSLWAAQGVDVNGRAAIEWYEIDAVTLAVLQSGLIDDVSLGLNYPSIAVNDFGDVVIGFSGGDPNTFMSSYFVAGQTVAGVTTFGAITQSMAGVADYQNLDGSGRNRWGEYSSTVLDPNLRAIWTFQEYASATDVWSIQATQIIFVHDNDGDDVLSNVDNCPDDYNPLQEDFDGDGVGYVCDITCASSMDFVHNFNNGDVFDPQASGQITFEGNIPNGADISFDAGLGVELKNGTSIDQGALFTILTAGCVP